MSNEIVYSVKPSKVQSSVAVISYALPDDRGVCRLLGVRFNSEAESKFKNICLAETPPEVHYVKEQIPKEMTMWLRAGVSVKDITELDVSFNRFWADYGKKIGNKTRVEKKYNALSYEEKVMALGVIPRMRRYYQAKRLDLPYAETYLDQRRYENLFE